MMGKVIAILLVLVVGIGIAADLAAPESAAPNIYQYTWTADTITNTEADTLNGATLYYDLFNYNYTLTATQLSGSTNIITVLQENNFTTGNATAWYEVERDTLAAAGTLRLYGGSNTSPSLIKGVRHRLILTGVGTQSSRYTAKQTLKKTN